MDTTIRPTRQLRLRGQAAVAGGPVDLTAMYVMHHGFRRDLALLARAARVTPTEDRVAWQALRGRWEVCAQVLHHHFEGEDVGVWPALLARCTYDERSVLEAMQTEHAELARLLDACQAGF